MIGKRVYVTRAPSPCSVDDCEKQAASKGLCSGHYARLRLTGDAGTTLLKLSKSPVVGGRKQCGRCSEWKPLADFNTHRHGTGGVESRCRTCQTAHNAAWREENRDYWKQWLEIPGNREKGITSSHNRRARIRNAEYEDIDRIHVFERDGWVCGICSLPIDPEAKFPSIESASLDHIVPLSKGGAHLYSNVQAAHFGCNSGKCDRLPDGVLEALL